MLKKLLTTFIIFILGSTVFAQDVWKNKTRALFNANSAIIYELNLRTFAAKDLNANGLIDDNEVRGNFLNAITLLDDIKLMNVNTLHLMPITPVGKINAIGTAASLYAPSDFSSINPQLLDEKSSLSAKAQAQKFIIEAHKRNLNVIIDLPACGSYDLYLKNPELFKFDENQKLLVPNDWNDVGIFNEGSNEHLNEPVLNLYKSFIDMVIELNADGIMINSPEMKVDKFWQELISYANKNSPDLFIFAETTNPHYLKLGFDSYYANFPKAKGFCLGQNLIDSITETEKQIKNFNNKKSATSNFSTHTEPSATLINGAEYSKMIIWLNSTLPINAHYLDGFATGDYYQYPWANKRAPKTYTDSDFYFADNGKIDIFNFSRRPGGNNSAILQEFLIGNRFKILMAQLMPNAKFKPLNADNPNSFAYAQTTAHQTLVIIGNLNFTDSQKIKIHIPKLKATQKIINIKAVKTPSCNKSKIIAELDAGEIQILLLNNFTIK